MFNALIRTHHMTSRKKIAKIKKAAHRAVDYVCIKTGAPPGLMYVEGSEQAVTAWVAVVHDLRYKHYQLLRRPEPLEQSVTSPRELDHQPSFEEVTDMDSFMNAMHLRGTLEWWRSAMKPS